MGKKRCICTLAQRLVGDGCSVCQPENALQFAMETIGEYEIDIKRLEDKLTFVMDNYLAPDQLKELERRFPEE